MAQGWSDGFSSIMIELSTFSHNLSQNNPGAIGTVRHAAYGVWTRIYSTCTNTVVFLVITREWLRPWRRPLFGLAEVIPVRPGRPWI